MHSAPHCRADLDSHADTCAFGKICTVIQQGRSITVDGYISGKTTTKAFVCTIAVAYDCPRLMQTFILIFHESLYIPSMKTHLLNPFQLRNSGIQINDIPLQHLEDSDRHTFHHSIRAPDSDLFIPLSLKGTMSGFTVRKPTWEEVNDTDQLNVVHVHMTNQLHWEPTDPVYASQEESLRQNFSYGSEMRIAEDRHIDQLQVRGQHSGGTYGSDDDSAPPLLARHPVDDDSSSSDEEEEPGVHFHPSIVTKKATFNQSDKTTKLRVVSPVHRPDPQKQALDVDSYADELLEEFETDAHNISRVGTYRKKKGFVTPDQLAKC